MHQKRSAVSDYWDHVVAKWIEGSDEWEEPLDRWIQAYDGKGRGAVDLRHYPDPYVGDLRGYQREPRIVVLGLNPGIGFDELQSRTGLWTQRIRETTFSRCFQRSPAEDPVAWLKLRGKPSRYWQNLIGFSKRWLNDEDASVADILSIELYPWHSISATAAITPPTDLVQQFILDPISEIEVSHVFAFGTDWFNVADRLKLRPLQLYQPDSPDLMLHGGDRAGWRLGRYALAGGQTLVVSAQRGYAGPPGSPRLSRMRELLAAR